MSRDHQARAVERLPQAIYAAILAGRLDEARATLAAVIKRQLATTSDAARYPASPRQLVVRRAALRLLGRIVSRVYAVAYPLAVAYWRVRRPHSTSVLVVVCCQNQVLLVRHPYGRSQWMPPGGAVKSGEALDRAARREVREELGIELAGLVQHGAVRSRLEGRHDTTWVFSAEVASLHFQADSWEIADARWFAIPQILSSHQPAFQGLDRCLRMAGRV